MSKIYVNTGSLEDKIMSKYDPLSYAHGSAITKKLGITVHEFSASERIDLCINNPDFAWAYRRTMG